MKKVLAGIIFLLLSSWIFGQVAPEKVLNAKKHRVWCIAYSNDGNYIASGGDDGSVIIYKTDGYIELARFEGLKGIPIAVCFSSDGKLLAAGGKDNRVTIWDFNSRKMLFQLKGHKAQIMDLEFSPNNKLLASASYDKTIKIWDPKSGALQKTLTGHEKEVNSLSFSPNGERLVSGSGDKTVKIWDVAKGAVFLNIPAHSNWVRVVRYSPDGSLIASGSDDRKIHLWDAISGQKLNTFLGHKNWVMSLSFSPDGHYLLSGGQDNLIILTDLINGKMIFQSEKQNEKILSIAFNPNGQTFAFAALLDEDLQVWNARKLNIKPMGAEVAKQLSSKSGMVPKIDWVSPAQNMTSNEASLMVKATINSESSLRRIELYVNNVLFSSKDRSELMLGEYINNTIAYEELVVLNNGINTIQIKAKNIVGEAISTKLQINYSAIPIELLSWMQPSVPEQSVNNIQFETHVKILKAGLPQEVSILVNGKNEGTHQVSEVGGEIKQVLNLLPGKNAISFRVKTARYTKESDTRIINYIPAGKPEISWLQPEVNEASYISSINIKANIKSQINIDKIEIKVNGFAVFTKRFLESDTYLLDKNIQVSPGKNNIVIIASNKTGETISMPKVITYQAPEKTDISWIFPSSDENIFMPQVELKACIQSKSSVTSLKVYNNSALIFSENNPTVSVTGECSIELVKLIVLNKGANVFKIEAENAAGTTQSVQRTLNYIIPSLASVQWIEPTASQVASTDKNFKIKACITSNTPIQNVDLIANNQIISSTPSQQNLEGDCTVDYEQLIYLNSGNNTVMLKVKNKAGEAISQPLFIEYKSANPYRFALIIGNEDYSSYQTGLNSESNVDFAINDASEFKKTCIEKFGIKEENIVYLENARQMEMVRSVNKLSLLIKASDGKAEVFVYYAGHGFPDEKTKEPFLIPVDVSGNDLSFGGGLKLTKFYELLTEYPSQRITVFLDACFSGGARNQGLVAARGVKIVPKEVKQSVKKSLIVFSASSGSQTSLPYQEQKHGMFTYFLLKKINDTNGNVTYQELSDYLKYEVNVKSLMINNKEQQPQTNVSDEVGEDWKNWKFK